MGRRHIKPGARLQFTLSTAERDLILERTFIDPEMEQQLREAQMSDSRLVIRLTLADVEDVAGYIAAEANHCKDRRVQRALYAVYDRLSQLQHEYTDEPPTFPVVATTDRVSPLKYTAKQGQYLCVHLLLQQDSWDSSSGSRPAAILSRISAGGTPNHRGTRTARAHRAAAGEGVLDSAADRSIRVAGFGVVAVRKEKGKRKRDRLLFGECSSCRTDEQVTM